MQIVHSDFQDQLVRGLSHRMNNVLTLFHGYLSLLSESNRADPDTVTGLSRIKEGAAQATELMERTYALVRPPSMVVREIQLAEFVSSIRPGFAPFRGPKTHLDLQLGDDCPRIQGDASRIKMAIVELVKNAFEATYLIGGTVSIFVGAEANAGQRQKWAVIRVEDDGPGIPENLQEKVFLPFFSTKKRQNSAGLGLTIVASIVQLHRGALTLNSKPGRTIAEIRLPAAE
jgi:signal transduction histidine kinase